jgi:hypothetical protein
MTPVVNGCRLFFAAFFNATRPKNVNLFSGIVDILIPIFFLGGAAGPSAAFSFSTGARDLARHPLPFDFWTAAVHCRFGSWRGAEKNRDMLSVRIGVGIGVDEGRVFGHDWKLWGWAG